MTDPDVAVVGLGPAGRALAHRCAAAGIVVAAVDPHPDRRWTPTYSAWADELPPWISPAAVAAAPVAWTPRRRTLERPYAVLDTDSLQHRLDLANVRVYAGRARTVEPNLVELSDGRIIKARHVFDARGNPRQPGQIEQTAYGIVVGTAIAAPALDGSDALFMDWRLDNGATRDDLPSFLYAVPLAGDRFLLEETCLLGRPALGHTELRRRLEVRLRRRGVRVNGGEPVERVRFPMTAPLRRANTFGARAGMLHPGTGYSVARSLRAADSVADAIAAGMAPTLWSPQAKAVDQLRRIGQRALLRLEPGQVAPFFDTFFDLPVPLQRAYLSEPDNLRGIVVAMRSLFARSSNDIRWLLATSSVPFAGLIAKSRQ